MATIRKDAKLTLKRQEFCRQFVVDFNAAAAAIRAGFSKKTAKEQGYQILQATAAQEYIKELIDEKKARTAIDADSVLERQDEILNRCLEHKEATDEDGQALGFFIFDAKNANTACANLGRFLGMGSTKIDISLTDEEVRDTIKKLLQIVAKRTTKKVFAKIVSDMEATGDA